MYRIKGAIRQVLTKTPYLWRFRDLFMPPFPGVAEYWEERYRSGGNSGAGSYGHLAEFKAAFLNQFVADNNVDTIIEFGCGDGAQLYLAQYNKYIGCDVSPQAVQMCIEKFRQDKSKSFFLLDTSCFLDNLGVFCADLGLSLDVVYHLVEDFVFESYMQLLFACARRFVIIYSSNHDEIIPRTHVRHRKFTDYVEAHFPGWLLIDRVKQQFPLSGDQQGSWADFFIYRHTLAT